jgi:hypothetical protein
MYLHSDDMERTIDSGQMLFNSMYPPSTTSEVIQWHTRDKSRAILSPQWKHCPRLEQLAAAVKTSAAMRRFNGSIEVLKLRKSWEWVLEQRGKGPNAKEVKKMSFDEAMNLADALADMKVGKKDASARLKDAGMRLRNKAGGAKGVGVLSQSEFPFTMSKLMDCLYTARCSRRRIPWGVTESLFNRTVRYKERLEQILLRYNGSEFSRLAMRPLLALVWTHIQQLGPKKPKRAKTAGRAGRDGHGLAEGLANMQVCILY